MAAGSGARRDQEAVAQDFFSECENVLEWCCLQSSVSMPKPTELGHFKMVIFMVRELYF